MPDDFESVISAAVEDSGDVVDTPTDAPVDTTSTAPPVDGGTPDPTAQVEDAFATEHGLTPKRPDGRMNRIPYDRVKAIAENRERKVIATVARELGISKAEAELKIEDILGTLTERKTKFADFEKRIGEVDSVESIMTNDPARYIQMLAMVNPEGYGRFAAVLQQAAEAQTTPQETAADDPMPEPDLDLGDGRRTYSLDGLAKRDQWVERKLTRQFESKLGERLKPIEEERQKAAERQKAETVQAQANERITAQIEKARKWHGFADHEADILKALQADRTISLHDAYIQVVMPKIAADRTRMRQEILEELKKAPAATSTTAQTAPPAPSASGSYEDIIKASIAGLKR